MEIFGLRKCFCGSRNVDYTIYGFEGYVSCEACQIQSPVKTLWPGESSSEFRERVRRSWNEHITSMYSTCTALVTTNHIVVHESAVADEETPFKDDAASQEATEQKLADVLARKDTVRHALNRIMRRLSDFNSTITKANSDLIEEKRAVEAEIAQLTAEIQEAHLNQAANHVKDDLDEEFEGFDTPWAEGGAEFEEHEPQKEQERDEPVDEPEHRPVVAAKVKKLFRRIANKTHPDKTDDPEYHQLFRSAKQYYRDGDYEGLLEIWNYISGTVSRVLSKILRRLQKEIEELRNIERQLNAVRSSNDYQLLTLYEQQREAVLMQVRLQFTTKLSQLKAHATMLRQIAGREAKQQQPANVFFEF